MHRLRPPFLAVALLVVLAATPTLAGNPRNPYAGFNLSGINYGAMQWERDHRAGTRVWPSTDQPVGSRPRATVSAGGWNGGTGGAVVRPGGVRGWRRARR
jgi:hypothetical protein